MSSSEVPLLLGAHVSTSGGVATAPARGDAIHATAIQIFTKTPNQWRDPAVDHATATAFRTALAASGVRFVVVHDSYLINLASPDPAARGRSIKSFIAELQRTAALGITAIVSHPGNYMDDPAEGIARNAAAYTECLEAVPGDTRVLLETTAGTGTALGSTFEELAALREGIGPGVRHRIAFCADTCHLYSAGHDLVGDWNGVWKRWDDILGFDSLACLHLNDSRTPFASRKDRHALIGEGSLGEAPFRTLMTDPRFTGIPRILETPKGDDETTNDRRMIALLRSWLPSTRGG